MKPNQSFMCHEVLCCSPKRELIQETCPKVYMPFMLILKVSIFYAIMEQGEVVISSYHDH